MGFTFRKTIGKKNLRLNLSKSGASISTGVKGLRVVTRPKGVRLYGQKTIGGVQLRYIKTLGPGRGVKNKKAYQKESLVSKSKYCATCGKSIDSDSTFCEHCGQKVAVSKTL